MSADAHEQYNRMTRGELPRDVDWWLAECYVDVVDDYHNEVNEGKLSGILGWYFVCDPDEGVIAYFSTPEAAFRHRLALINDKLNPPARDPSREDM